MSIYAGPDNSLSRTVNKTNISGIITTNLILYYDLGRSYSYNGSGSTLSDISGNEKNATMYNAGGSTYSLNSPGAPTFNRSRMGEFVFDGNDFGKFPSISAGANITLSVWCKTTNSSRDNGIISNCNGGPVNLGYSINSNKMKYMYYDGSWKSILSTTSVNDGNWKNLVWAKQGTNMKLYINNILDSTHTLDNSVGGPLTSIGCLWGPCNSDSYGPGTDSYGSAFIGSIGIVMIYSKQLSESEIENNYFSLKSRYGL